MNERFTSCDLNLAAYLRYKHHDVVEVLDRGNKKYLSFNISPSLQSDLIDFLNNKPVTVIPGLLLSELRATKSLIFTEVININRE